MPEPWRVWRAAAVSESKALRLLPATASTAPLDLGDVLDRAIKDDRKDRRNEHIRRKRSERAA